MLTPRGQAWIDCPQRLWSTVRLCWVLTNYHECAGLTRSQFQSPEVLSKSTALRAVMTRTPGGPVSCRSQVLVTAGILELCLHCLQSLPLWSHCLLSSVFREPSSSFHKATCDSIQVTQVIQDNFFISTSLIASSMTPFLYIKWH
jgi:hypothetical protein